MQIPRILIIIAGILMLSLFLFPLWRITLIAPQYPDGVSMHIWINKIDGDKPGALQNINILNHYIGMKKIEPDSIPELTYFPYFVVSFFVLALIAAGSNNRFAFLFWLVFVLICAILGMYDFYLWEYNYGHELSETAPMKFDESFQPPLIGEKTILNFVAQSYPHIGGYLVTLSILTGAFATWLKFRQNRNAVS